jgi:ABC-type branched-subunit amino acid transport system substrate-binding protein
MDAWLRNGVFLVVLAGIVTIAAIGLTFSQKEPGIQGKAIQSVVIHDQEGSSVAVSDGRVRLGIISPLSGNYAFIGKDVVSGVELAREDLKNGIWQGKDIDIVYRDSACDASLAAKQAASLLDDGISYVLSVDCYGNALPGEEGKVVLSSGRTFLDSYGFSSDISDELDQLLSRLERSSLAVIFVDNLEGWTYQTELAKKGEVLSSYAYAFGQNEFDAIAKKVVERDPGRVFVVAEQFSDLVPILESLRSAGYYDEVATNVLITDADLARLGTRKFAFENVVFSADIDVQSKRTMVVSFLDRIDGRVSTYSANAYDEVMIVGTLIAEEGDLPIRVGDRLQALVNYEGVTGVLTFSKSGVQRMTYTKRILDGRIVDVT